MIVTLEILRAISVSESRDQPVTMPSQGASSCSADNGLPGLEKPSKYDSNQYLYIMGFL